MKGYAGEKPRRRFIAAARPPREVVSEHAMRVLLLLGALYLIIAAARRWDQIHPLRTAAGVAGTRSPSPGGGLDGQTSYLDLTLLERHRARPGAARRESGHSASPAGARAGARSA